MYSLQKVLIFLLAIVYIQNKEPGQDTGAYLSTPDPKSLQYRLGNGLGFIGNGWEDNRMANLSIWTGYDGKRKKLPEQHFVNWGYGIELGVAQKNTKLGILDIVGYLATPTEIILQKHQIILNYAIQLIYTNQFGESMEQLIQKIIGLIMSIKLYQYTKTILKYGKLGMNQIILKIIIMLENDILIPQSQKI